MRKRTSSEVGISQTNFEYGRNSKLFTLKVHYGRAFTGEIEKKYVGGCLDYFDDCKPIDMKLSVLIHMTNGLGYGTNVGFLYKIPVVNGDFSLRKIEMEDDIVDMAAIGKQNGSVELYITQANNIAFLDSEVGQLGEIAEGDNEDSKGDSGSFNGEEFHDSDYDFCKDDDVIYNQSVATAGRDLSIVLGIKEVGHEEEQGIDEPEQHEPHEAGQKHKHVKATDACDVNIFHEEQIQVTVGAFQEKVHRELNANITRHQVYKTFQKAKILIYGKYKKQYSEIWDYYEELLKKNPGSTVDIVTVVDKISGKERFQRMYICFESLKRGFREGCRPVIGVDGCHLRGPHPGILLTAVGIDPNDCIYPIAYAVVEIENKNSWRWFIEHLKYDLEIYDQQSWTFISDRQKGLGSAIHEILPRIEHRHCVRHLHNNFKKLHPGDSLKARVWACARSTYRKRFDNEMESLC
ncbi:hypothetical protein ACH5RR_029360 [Cinchona calisaya]|uniref:MULE transposase domain-containing protein n=1 Tax=Cinchona calisaya TaxID=153742 RepID=A0ABD2YT23_9GENT